MKIPKSIKVAGHVYTISFPYIFTERTDLCGASHHDTLKFLISDISRTGEPKPRSAIEETLMHEIVHAVDVKYNAGKLDEETVQRLSEGLYQVLSDAGMFSE
jgi:hypothetical protein